MGQILSTVTLAAFSIVFSFSASRNEDIIIRQNQSTTPYVQASSSTDDTFEDLIVYVAKQALALKENDMLYQRTIAATLRNNHYIQNKNLPSYPRSYRHSSHCLSLDMVGSDGKARYPAAKM